MPGLVFVDVLRLSLVQHVGIALAMWVLLSGQMSRWKVVFSQAVVLAVFWDCPLSRDTQLLFQSAGYLQRFTWGQFLSEMNFQNYVKLQPPFYSFYVSRWPALTIHQSIMSAWTILCGCLMLTLYGEKARFLLATPVWILMSSQPSNDLVLFGLVLICLRLIQLGYTNLAALIFGVTYPVKPLALLILPVMAMRLSVPVLGSLAVWGGYVTWSAQYYFGETQWSFLLHQLCLR